MNVLVVDMLEGFTRQGALASPRVEALIPRQVEFLKSLPDDAFVVFACDAHEEGDSEFKRMPVHCMKGTKEAEICHELLEVVNDRNLDYEVVSKFTHSAFYGTTMDSIIAAHEATGGSTDWIVIGCVTDICITAAVMDLDYRGKNVTVYEDLVDTYEITYDQSIQICGSNVKHHDPKEFNRVFLQRYLPGVWGAKIEVFNEKNPHYPRFPRRQVDPL